MRNKRFRWFVLMGALALALVSSRLPAQQFQPRQDVPRHRTSVTFGEPRPDVSLNTPISAPGGKAVPPAAVTEELAPAPIQLTGGPPKTMPPLQENPLPHPPADAEVDEKGPALGMEELEQLALQNNPTLVQAALLVEAARSKALQAGLWPNPIVGYSADQIGQKGTAGEFQGGFVQQEIITAHKRQISRAKYNQQARSAEARAAQQELKVLNGVRMHYFRLLAVGRLVRLREGLLGNATEEYRTTLEEFNAGHKDRAQVLLARNRLAESQIDRQTEKNRYGLLWRELAALVGVPDLPCSSLQGQLEPLTPPLEWHSSLTRILEDSPEILLAHTHVEFDKLTLEREKREPIPNITVKGGVGYNAIEKETVSLVQVQFPLPVWNWNQGNIRQVQADLSRSLADVRRVELQLQKRLAVHYNRYQNALILVQTFQKENVPNAFQAYEVYLDQYKQRRIPWPEVIRLHRNWLMVRLAYVQHLMQLREEEVTITGLLTVDGLTDPPAPPPVGHLGVNPQPR